MGMMHPRVHLHSSKGAEWSVQVKCLEMQAQGCRAGLIYIDFILYKFKIVGCVT